MFLTKQGHTNGLKTERLCYCVAFAALIFVFIWHDFAWMRCCIDLTLFSFCFDSNGLSSAAFTLRFILQFSNLLLRFDRKTMCNVHDAMILPTLSYHMKNELSKRAKMFFYLIMHRNTSTAPDWFILQQCIYEIVHFRTIHHTSDVCRYSGAAFTQRPPNWGFEFGKRRLIERRTNKALL